MSIIIFGKHEPCREVITTDKEHGNSMHHIYKFPNGYRASVIQDKFSEGHEDGLYELEIIKAGKFCYGTPITCDIIERLSADEVAEHLSWIERLPDLKEKRKEGSKLCNTQKLYSK